MKFKVRCIDDAGSCHTIGKIYEIRDGIMGTDRHDTMQSWGYSPFKSVEDINSQLNSKFELLEEENMFTKDDLKVGQLMELRGGKKAIVMPYINGLCFVDENGFWCEPNEYNNEMLAVNKEYDIMAVFGLAEKASEAMMFSTRFRSLLWQREESPVELTIEEIAKKFGVEAGRVRIKE